MDVARKAIAFAVIGLIAGTFPISAAHAGPGNLVDDSLGGLVGETVDNVGKTVDTVGKTVDKTVEETTGETPKDPTEPVTGPVIEDVNETLGLNPGRTNPQTTDTTPKKSRASGDRTRKSGRHADAEVLAAAYLASFDRMAAREARRELENGGFDRTVSFRSTPEPNFGDRAAQAALDAAKAFTFPAILIGLIVGFILVQNRIDHRDPKLAYAPVSSDQDFLSFS